MIKICVLEYAKRSGEFRVVKQFDVIFVSLSALPFSLCTTLQEGGGASPGQVLGLVFVFLVCFKLYVSFALQSIMEHKTYLSSIEWDRTWEKTFLFLFVLISGCAVVCWGRWCREIAYLFPFLPQQSYYKSSPWSMPALGCIERFAPKSSVRAAPWVALSISPDDACVSFEIVHLSDVTRTNFVIIPTPGAGDARPPRYHPIVFILRITMLRDNFNKSRREIRGPSFSRPLHVAALGEN